MKKILVTCLVFVLCIPSAFAMPGGTIPYGIGAKYAAMGGAGSALVDDIAAAYYNPAGMARAQAIAIKVGAGTATDGMDKIMGVLGSVGNPAKFLADNFSSAIDVRGNLNLAVGLDIAKIGISTIPVANLTLNKTANTLAGTANAAISSDTALTMGYGTSLPYVGSFNWGFNAKYIYNGMGGATVGVSGPTTTDITNTLVTYSGMGYDLGIQGKITAIPTAPISVGIVYKDIATSLNGHNKVTKATYDNTNGQQVGGETVITDADIAGMTLPTTLVLGAAGTIPVVGVTLAADLDNVSGSGTSFSVTHIGAEYPVAMGLVKLRAGLISGGPSGAAINMTTYGAGILGDMINVAMVSDNNNTKNNQMMADVHIGF